MTDATIHHHLFFVSADGLYRKCKVCGVEHVKIKDCFRPIEFTSEFIKAAARERRYSKDTTLSRAQIELAGAMCRAVDVETAREVSLKHFGDERYRHIALFTNKEGATAFMLDLLGYIKEQS